MITDGFDWSGLRVAFVLTGSYCTLDKALDAMAELAWRGAAILPVISFSVARWDSRFGEARYWRQRIEEISGAMALDTIAAAEPIGPRALADVAVVAPCTGNTLAKLTAGVTDTPALMAIKSHLRISRPVVLSIATNDALAANARNIGDLLNRKHIYFVPFRQDDPENKPTSLISDISLLPETIVRAMAGRQLQPILAR